MTNGINTNPIANVTDPNSIRAREIPRKSDAKAVGEAAARCLEVDADADDEDVPTVKGMGRGGDLRIWMIMELSSWKTLDCWSSSFIFFKKKKLRNSQRL